MCHDFIAVMKATEQEMKDAQVPINFRDYCADILIKLNECRKANYWMPGKCEELMHAYEKCQYHEYVLFSLLLFFAEVNSLRLIDSICRHERRLKIKQAEQQKH